MYIFVLQLSRIAVIDLIQTGIEQQINHITTKKK